MERYLGIDFGSRRIGVALSDPLGFTASGIETVYRKGKDIEEALARILELAKQHQVCAFVVGLPKRTDLRPTESEEAAREFAELLEARSGLDVYLRDERLTTVMAHQYLQAGGVKMKDRRDIVDQVAAEIILQSFLEEQRNKRRSGKSRENENPED